VADSAEAPEILDLLAHGQLEVLGQLVDSSNGALLVEVVDGQDRILAIHKPITFERPLWDFPDGHLAWRERAAYLVATAAGLGQVPPTMLRDGPWGPGSIQEWIGGSDGSDLEDLVTVCAPEDVPTDWRRVLSGQDAEGHDVVLAHSADEGVADLALLDALLNNTDRKGSHVVRARGRVWGFDHGVTLGAEPKLRTVLWGWAGQPLGERDHEALARLRAVLDHHGGLRAELSHLLTAAEIDALHDRATHLVRSGVHPLPSPHWPAIPWPAM
jgi:uncharacterized repeat protein (TIGR03843 family)